MSLQNILWAWSSTYFWEMLFVITFPYSSKPLHQVFKLPMLIRLQILQRNMSYGTLHFLHLTFIMRHWIISCEDVGNISYANIFVCNVLIYQYSAHNSNVYTNFHKDCSVEETCSILKLYNIVNKLEHFMNIEVTLMQLLCNIYHT